MRWIGAEQNNGVGKNSGSVLSYLWTKVHELLRQCRRPFVFFNAFGGLSMSRFVQVICAIKPQSRRETEYTCKSFLPQFPIFGGETTQTFLWQFVSAIYCMSTVWQI